MRYLLLGCSEDKVPDPQPLPALDRYNGPAYKTLRRFLRENPQARAELSVAIISAEFGLIYLNTCIPPYNQRMTLERAQDLNSVVSRQLRDWLQTSTLPQPQPQTQPQPQLFYMLGKDYQICVNPESTWLPPDLTIHRAYGGFMAQRTQLLAWLQGNPIPQIRKPGRIPEHERATAATANGTLIHPEMQLEVTGRVRLSGVIICGTPQEIEERVAQWLQDPQMARGHERTRFWTAQVGPYTVAPKWLVARLSGLPVSAFAAADARRVLARLGIPMTEHSENPFKG